MLIDADDTLWHNNIYFEQTTETFIDYLRHTSLGRDEIKQVIMEIEHANLQTKGYGAESYANNLVEAYIAGSPNGKSTRNSSMTSSISV
ncbi:MAG: hypothetical protein R2848_15870 [Thermomicrobiales bacterium]